MLNKLKDLKILTQSLLKLKTQMNVVVTTMKEIDVINIDKNIKKASKEEIKEMKNINTLLDDIEEIWNKKIYS